VASATKIRARRARLARVSKPARIVVVDHAAPPADLFTPGERFQAGLIALSGDLFGQAMLVFPDAVAEELARSLSLATHVNAPAGAALEEATNIFANTALGSITRDFKLSVYPPRPRRRGVERVRRSDRPARGALDRGRDRDRFARPAPHRPFSAGAAAGFARQRALEVGRLDG
jgi:hypothetical protein